MARIRTIKPEFFTSLTVADLTPEQRLTFIGLWTHADDEGRCVDDARLIKAALWPLDDRTAADIEIDIKALSATDLITRYVCRGKRYIAVTNWHEHQKINRPSDSKFPAPEDGEPLPPDPSGSRRAHGGLTEDSNDESQAGFAGSGIDRNDASSDHGASGGQNGPLTGDWTPEAEYLTSTDTRFTDSSVSTHVQLSESSSQERKGKEGNREGKGNPPTPRDQSGSSAVVQTGRALPDRMTDAFLERFARGNAYSKRQVRRTIADTLSNGTDPDELWRALLRLGETSKPVSAGTLQFAFAEIRKPTDNVVQMRPSTTDARVAQGLALAAKYREQEQRAALEAGHTPPQETA